MQPFRSGTGPDGTIVLDREFGAAALSGLRDAVLQRASAAGLDHERSIDVMIALHELAANAIRHGAGRGWLRMRVTTVALYCQVGDAGTADQENGAPAIDADGIAGTAAWPVEHGHGLWLVRKIADRVQIVVGPAGSVVSVAFNLPGS